MGLQACIGCESAPYFNYAEKVDHSKGYWNPRKKSGVTRRFQYRIVGGPKFPEGGHSIP